MTQNNIENLPITRRFAASEIKLLRLELISHSKSIFEDLGDQWSHAQPAETLSPQTASVLLNIEIWAPQSSVKKRYKILQSRYPPEQFMDKHIDWRPSYELLHIPRNRLNWFWQSGFIPYPTSKLNFDQNLIWDEQSAHAAITAKKVLNRLSNILSANEFAGGARSAVYITP